MTIMKQMQLFDREEYVLEFRKPHKPFKILWSVSSKSVAITRCNAIMDSRLPGAWRLKHKDEVIWRHFKKE